MTITYENQNGRKISGERSWNIDVRLDGKIVGDIRHSVNGYYYKPKGRKQGETFPTLEQVKRSLEG